MIGNRCSMLMIAVQTSPPRRASSRELASSIFHEIHERILAGGSSVYGTSCAFKVDSGPYQGLNGPCVARAWR